MSFTDTNSVHGVIARSISVHPTLFADQCEASASEDRKYISQRQGESVDKRALEGARSRAEVLEFAASTARAFTHDPNEAARRIMLFRGVSWVAPLNIAARCQSLPRHVVTALVVKEERKNDA